jgi:DNA-binding LacI/PurR family transcriptional regulator
VINGFERVNPETRQRVEAAIAELGYQPNAIARSMAQGRTHTLACLAPNLTDFTFASIIEGAENEARQHGYFLLTASAPDQESFVLLVDQLLASRRAEGLVLITPFLDSYHTHLPRYVRAVYVSADPHLDGASSVMLDDLNAGAMATRHLIDLGHREIAQITGPLVEDCARNRLLGYQTTLQAANIQPNSQLIAQGDWSATSGYRIVSKMLAEKVRFSAIFAQNDRMAIGAIHALRQAGKHVPQDVSVIGFDDMPLASYFDPAITTIQQDTFRMGREAARLLIDAVEQPEPAFHKVLIGAELIVRQSTGRFSG